MSTTTPTGPPPVHLKIVTPSRRAISADPPHTLRRSYRATTPGTLGGQTPREGLSASGRKIPLATTPHGRAAMRALDSRRAAIFTPNRRATAGRRRSLRDLQRETPRDPLRALSRLLAPRTEPFPSSSSSSPTGDRAKTESDTGGLSGFVDDDDDDDDDERPLRPPRLSLPIEDDDEDGEDDSSDILPHRSAGLEDADNFTMQSIELPRRAISEQPNRYSLGGGAVGRMSDFYGQVEDDSAFFPPLHAIDEDAAAAGGRLSEEEQEDMTYERVDAYDRRATGRESDFGIVIPPPMEADESMFVMDAEAADSPSPDRFEPLDPFEPFDDDEELQQQQQQEEEREESHVHFEPDVTGGEDDAEMDPGPDVDEQGAASDVEVDEFDVETETAAAMATARDEVARATKKTGKPKVRVSKHGIKYPSLPPATVKRLAQTFAKTGGAKGKISPDALAAIVQASDWFFEQLGDDLQAFAKHAGRKTIDESDMLQVMRRQRQINSSATPFSLAQRFLPRELLQELRMPPPVAVKKARKGKSRADDDGDGDGDEEIT